MDIEEWRQSIGLTLKQLAEVIGCPSLSQARRYALGEERISDERLERVLIASDGAVDLYAVHRRRMKWLASNGRPIGVISVGVAELLKKAKEAAAA